MVPSEMALINSQKLSIVTKLISVSTALSDRANTTQLYGRRPARPLPYIAVTFPAIRPVPNYTAW